MNAYLGARHLLRSDELKGLCGLDRTECEEGFAEVLSEIGMRVLAVLGEVRAFAPVRDLFGAINEKLRKEHEEVRNYKWEE